MTEAEQQAYLQERRMAGLPDYPVDTVMSEMLRLYDVIKEQQQRLSAQEAARREICDNCKLYEREVLKQAMDRHPIGTCPVCGAPIVHRFGRYGRFIGCTRYPRCSWTASEEGRGVTEGDPESWREDVFNEDLPLPEDEEWGDR